MTATATERKLTALANRLDVAPRAPSGRICKVRRAPYAGRNGKIEYSYSWVDEAFNYVGGSLGTSGREAEAAIRALAAR